MATGSLQTTSYSRVSSFTQCPRKWKYHYIDELEALPDDDPANALILGKALHKGIECGVEAGIKEYYSNYFTVNDLHVNEEIKLRYYIEKALELLPDGLHEVDISSGNFKGFIDLLADNGDGSYQIWDFKYCNPKSVDRYKLSQQLHVYLAMAYAAGYKNISHELKYLIIPKVSIRQYKAGKTRKRAETIEEFRKRLRKTLAEQELQVITIEYNADKMDEFEAEAKAMLAATEFPPNPSPLCSWCDYQQLCEKGHDDMLLPSKERRAKESAGHVKIWLYGAPFAGKTTLANQFPDPIMLNTDGNIKYVDAPFVAIKDVVEVEGRRTITTQAWQVFKDAIDELSKPTEFKTIIVDVLDDLHEACRLYIYEQQGWAHESDNGFAAWDMVRMEFLSTIRRLTNLDYNIVLISHEDIATDLTKRSNDKITRIKPVLSEKIANKVAGMVDVVARVVVIDGKHLLSFKTDEVQFGGGRIEINTEEVNNDIEELYKIYGFDVSKTEPVRKSEPTSAENAPVEAETEQEAEQPKHRRRTIDSAEAETVSNDDPAEEKPARRSRKPRSEEN